MQLRAILAYLAEISTIDFSVFTPLYFGAERLGWVNAEWCQRLSLHEPQLFSREPDRLVCTLLDQGSELEEQLTVASQRWLQAGWISGWRNERFQVEQADGQPCFALERAVFRCLGLTSHAVHLNGLIRLPSGEIGMWLGRRSPDKAVDANRMDNMVGGGVSAGESIAQACAREGWEEAGLSLTLILGARPVSRLLAERPVTRGVHREWLHSFDIWMPADYVPCNQDGEVAEHLCLPLAQVESLLLERRFSIDAALVCADCLARLGFWGIEGHQVISLLRHAGSRHI